MAITYPLIEFGTGVYATDTGLVGGSRVICEIDGLEGFLLTDNIGIQRAVDGTVNTQYQAVKDERVVIRFPLITTTRFGAIKTVIQNAVTGNTTHALNITGDLGTFTFTAKPGGISARTSILSGYVAAVEIISYCTD
jgi:hypothetical protein